MIQRRHSGHGLAGIERHGWKSHWVPAFAGMTASGMDVVDPWTVSVFEHG
jgi:hypothetical protein